MFDITPLRCCILWGTLLCYSRMALCFVRGPTFFDARPLELLFILFWKSCRISQHNFTKPISCESSARELEKSEPSYLNTGVYPDGLSKDQKKLIRLKANSFVLSNVILLYVGPDKKYQESPRQVVHDKELQKRIVNWHEGSIYLHDRSELK